MTVFTSPIPTVPVVCRTIEEFHTALKKQLPDGGTLGFVPTMGALHSGHQKLFRTASDHADAVAISVFVNPLQFDREEDFQNYPRQLDKDVAAAAVAGVDIVFAPDTEVMYPAGTPRVSVSAGAMGTVLEGALRPGHFDGVCTVVAKLFNIVAAGLPRYGGATNPDVHAFFGQKDAQQLAIITAMVEDLNLPVQIHAVPIVRNEHGLALSSRNQRLSEDQLVQARSLHRALSMLRDQAETGQPLDVAAAVGHIEAEMDAKVDELSVVDAETFEPLTPDQLSNPAAWPAKLLALVAAFVGPVRLIDNMMLKGNS